MDPFSTPGYFHTSSSFQSSSHSTHKNVVNNDSLEKSVLGWLEQNSGRTQGSAAFDRNAVMLTIQVTKQKMIRKIYEDTNRRGNRQS